MHVLYIHQHFATNDSYAGTKSYDFARYLVSKGHRVTVLAGATMLGQGEEGIRLDHLLNHVKVSGIDIVVIKVPYSNKMGFVTRVLSFLAFAGISCGVVLAERDVDIVYASSTPLTVGVPAVIARLLKGTPYVFEVRDIWPEIPIAMGILKNPLLIWTSQAAEALFYRCAERVVGISEGIVRRLNEKGVAADKLELLYTGVDVELYEQSQKDTAALEALGLGGRFVCVYAGAISTVNNIEYIVDAATKTKDGRLGFLVVGEGKDRKRIQALVEERQLKNMVVTGPMPKHKLVGLLKACDLGMIRALPLDVFKPGMPNKLFDYLAAGLPVVANYPAEHNDHFVENKCGWVIPSDDPSSLPKLMTNLLCDPDKLAAMRKSAKDLAQVSFNRKILANRLERILLGVLGQGLDVGKIDALSER